MGINAMNEVKEITSDYKFYLKRKSTKTNIEWVLDRLVRGKRLSPRILDFYSPLTI